MFEDFGYIENNIIEITGKINEAMSKRKDRFKAKDVKLLAVTKTVEVEKINFAISKGIKLIGENRVNELLGKYDALDKENLCIHFIGNLQTNKVKYIIDKVDMIQSVNSLKLAEEIDKRAGQHNKVMDVLVEINIGREETKIGINPAETEKFLSNLSHLKNIRVKGLMTIPPPLTSFGEQNNITNSFKEIHEIFVDISAKNIDNINNIDMCLLSMGMSGDFEEAIMCGSDIVRIGTAIFRNRN